VISNFFKLGLTPSQIMIAEYIKSNPRSTTVEYIRYLPMSEATIRRALERLLKLGVIEVIDIEDKGRRAYSVAEYGGYSPDDYKKGGNR